MSYQRKQEDQRRLKKLLNNCSGGYPTPVYEDNKPNKPAYLRRFWKSEGKKSSWAWHKKHARKMSRLYFKKHDCYTKKVYDPMWMNW